MDDHEWGFRTRGLHAGGRPDSQTGSCAVLIYQTTSYVFEDTADATDPFALQKFGMFYTRVGNPATAAFAERMTSPEGGIGAVASSNNSPIPTWKPQEYRRT